MDRWHETMDDSVENCKNECGWGFLLIQREIALGKGDKVFLYWHNTWKQPNTWSTKAKFIINSGTVQGKLFDEQLKAVEGVVK